MLLPILRKQLIQHYNSLFCKFGKIIWYFTCWKIINYRHCFSWYVPKNYGHKNEFNWPYHSKFIVTKVVNEKDALNIVYIFTIILWRRDSRLFYFIRFIWPELHFYKLAFTICIYFEFGFIHIRNAMSLQKITGFASFRWVYGEIDTIH